MAELDPIIHQPVRLRIMAALTSLHDGSALDFSTLGKLLKVTDGNLGAHLQTLEQAGYIKVGKSFVQRKPRTHAAATYQGRARFQAHVEALQDILRTKP